MATKVKEPEFKKVIITSQQAKRWLDKDKLEWENLKKKKKSNEELIQQRNLKNVKVKQIARAITKGDWKFTGDTIKVSQNGLITDGRHRLSACVMSGESIETMVFFNAPIDSSFDAIDDNVSRSGTDLLQMKGYKEPKLMASIIKMVAKWAGTIYKGTTTSDHLNMSNLEFHNLIKGDKNLIRAVEFATVFKNNKNTVNPVNTTIIGAMYYTMFGDQDAIKKLEEFTHEYMYNTSTDLNSHARKLMAKVEHVKREYNLRTVPTRQWEGFFIYAFDAYFKGRRMSSISSRAVDPLDIHEKFRIKIIKDFNERLGYEAINLQRAVDGNR